MAKATAKPAAKPAAALPAVATCKVKLLISRAGHSPSGATFTQSIGQEIVVPVDEAWRMSEAGQCTFIGDPPDRPTVKETALAETEEPAEPELVDA